MGLWRDVKHGARVLARARGFTLLAVVTLALGIGATTAMISLVRALFFSPLAVEDGLPPRRNEPDARASPRAARVLDLDARLLVPTAIAPARCRSSSRTIPPRRCISDDAPRGDAVGRDLRQRGDRELLLHAPPAAAARAVLPAA